MKIVITGALGHIGSRLSRKLPDFFENPEIVLIDNLSTQRFSSLYNLPENAKYRFIEDDVTSMELEPVIDGADAVIHLAAITDATSSFNNKEKVEFVNFTSTKRVAEACAKTGSAMIFPSSTSVYGTQKDLVDEDCTEEDLQPQSPYAVSKLKEEALLQEMSKNNGLKVAVCRFGTIFGTSIGMRFHTAVNKFCWQAVMGTPLTVWSSAYEQKRPYLCLTDAVRAVSFLIENKIYDGRIYNALTLNSTVRNIVENIKKYVPDLDVTFVDEQIMNQLSYEVANKRFTELGFDFNGDISEGIKETVELLKQSQSGKA